MLTPSLTICPVCGSEWSDEEIGQQHCLNCDFDYWRDADDFFGNNLMDYGNKNGKTSILDLETNNEAKEQE
jgi:hypothetical protein